MLEDLTNVSGEINHLSSHCYMRLAVERVDNVNEISDENTIISFPGKKWYDTV